MLGRFGQGAAAAGGARVGAADGEGHAGGDLVGGTQAGTEIVGEGEQRAPVLGGVEFAPIVAVLADHAGRRGGRVDRGGVVTVGALVDGR